MFAIYTSQCTLHHMPKCQHNLSVSRRHPETQFAEGQGIEKKLNIFSRFLPKFCQLTRDNTCLCSSSHSEAVGCASPAASSPKSRSVFTFPFVPIPPCSPVTKRHSLLSLITQVQILALCHHKAPLCRLSKEKEVFPTHRNAVLFPQEMGGRFSPFHPTPVSPAPQGG